MRASLVVACALAFLAFAFEAAVARPLPGASAAGMVLLPWLALAGFPGGAARAPGWLALALALPAVLLGRGLDGPETETARLVGGLALVYLLEAGRAHALGARARRLQAAIWCVLGPGLVALRAAVDWTARTAPGEEAGWTRAIELVSPLAFGLRALRVDTVSPWYASALPVAVALGCLALVRALAAPEAGTREVG